jgi:hypothetical protein
VLFPLFYEQQHNQGHHIMSTTRNNNGFGAIGIILVVVVIAVVGLGGWYVFNKNDKTESKKNNTPQTNNTNQNNNNQTPVADPSDGGKYLVLSEWGVRLKPATQLPKMSYVVGDMEGLQVARFTFDGMPADCTGFYWLSRAKAGQDIDGFGNSPEKLMSTNAASIKQVGEYYFYLGHGQGSCTTDSTAIEKQNMYAKQLAENNSYSIEALPSDE